MKEPEYTLSSDKRTWMENSVISDIPFKITIIDPREYIDGIRKALSELPSVKDAGFGKDAMEHFSRVIVQNIISGIVTRRAAWVHGFDYEVEIHISRVREMMVFELDFDFREAIRDDLNHPDHAKTSARLENILKDILTTVLSFMNPNPYVVHRITHSRDFRTLNLEEFADWRVIEWTKNEHAKIAATHENI